MGRPSKFNSECADRICEMIAMGSSLVSICKREEMPDYSTVLRWLRAHEAFRLSYMQAREDQADYLAEETIEIADDSGLDARIDPETGRPVVDGEAIQRSRLRVDARKWYAGKLQPKKYGDKTIHTGADGESDAVFTLDISGKGV